MNLFWSKKEVLVCSIACLSLMFIVLVDVALPCSYSGADYFKTSLGRGIKYRVTDSGYSLDCTIWAVSRPKCAGGFAFSLIENENEEGFFSNAWLGGKYVSELGVYKFTSGCPAEGYSRTNPSPS